MAVLALNRVLRRLVLYREMFARAIRQANFVRQTFTATLSPTKVCRTKIYAYDKTNTARKA